jgi:hypothetical protein
VTVSITGADASSFQIVGTSCNAQLPAFGGSCNVQVRFQPLLPGGMRQAQLQASAMPGGIATALLRN